MSTEGRGTKAADGRARGWASRQMGTGTRQGHLGSPVHMAGPILTKEQEPLQSPEAPEKVLGLWPPHCGRGLGFISTSRRWGNRRCAGSQPNPTQTCQFPGCHKAPRRQAVHTETCKVPQRGSEMAEE